MLINPNILISIIIIIQQLNKMHVDMWHIIIQCTIVIGLSPKDTCLYPNTLPIRSLLEVDFWVFHHRDFIPFLIRLTRAFTFHYYFIFLSFFHFMRFSQSLFFLHATMCKWNVIRLIILIHKYPKYQIKFPLV